MNTWKFLKGVTASAVSFLFIATTVFAQPATGGLTYGMVTKSIIKGQTTQGEIIQLFGSPNITTVAKDGSEVWTYDNISAYQTTEGGSDPKLVLVGGAA